MEDQVRIVQQFYDNGVEYEWNRFERHPFEFRITTRMMDRYIKQGDRILDIGGGPGRYALYFANKGCDVTLVDLSDENVKFTLEKAGELNINIKAVAGDAREVDNYIEGKFDHIFLMGPMYHLLNEKDRTKALDAAINLLKDSGRIYISFIQLFSGLIYGMKYMPELLLSEPEQVFVDAVLEDKSYGGDAFTKAYFTLIKDIEPFMAKFPLKKTHLFGQEGILSPCEPNILKQPQEIIDKWVEFAEKLCEREELLSYSEHVMYIGEKIK